jgi:hypothetical protein
MGPAFSLDAGRAAAFYPRGRPARDVLKHQAPPFGSGLWIVGIFPVDSRNHTDFIRFGGSRLRGFLKRKIRDWMDPVERFSF